VIACVGGGSNAMGAFHDFVGDESVRLIGVEAAGRGLDGHEHGATLLRGRPGFFTAPRLMCFRMRTGRFPTAGRSPPGSIIPPSDRSMRISRTAAAPNMSAAPIRMRWAPLPCSPAPKGIICAFESAHALAHALKMAEAAEEETVLVVNLSGRGDKDMTQARTC
jgi:tryptophan synthase beta chain